MTQPDAPGVRIDTAHANLLHGLVCAFKPARVLEFGFGGGRSAEAILRGIRFNQQPATYVLVDNWRDWSGLMPPEAREFFCAYPEARLSQTDEGAFVAGATGRYDFIMSDADHYHAHEWFERVYDDLLEPGGVLVYHDVRQFEGLAGIVSACVWRRLVHFVCDRNSRAEEACQRGLLVVFKPGAEQ